MICHSLQFYHCLFCNKIFFIGKNSSKYLSYWPNLFVKLYIYNLVIIQKKYLLFLLRNINFRTKNYNTCNTRIIRQPTFRNHRCHALTFPTSFEKSYLTNASSHCTACSSMGIAYMIPLCGIHPTVRIMSLILFTPTTETCRVLLPGIRFSSFTLKPSCRTFSASILHSYTTILWMNSDKVMSKR